MITEWVNKIIYLKPKTVEEMGVSPIIYIFLEV